MTTSQITVLNTVQVTAIEVGDLIGFTSMQIAALNSAGVRLLSDD